jgi:hypothetical protein
MASISDTLRLYLAIQMDHRRLFFKKVGRSWLKDQMLAEQYLVMLVHNKQTDLLSKSLPYATLIGQQPIATGSGLMPSGGHDCLT